MEEIGPSDVPLYVQIADMLREKIASGEIPPSRPLPSKRALREEYGVAANTVEHAYQVLKDEGLVRTVPGLGLFPAHPQDRPPRDRWSGVPYYAQLAARIAGQIRSGELQPGQAIPAEPALMRETGLARGTVRRALGLLREQGWIETVYRRGSRVAPRESWPRD